ncbi:MAG: PTS lactose/cellobiose transporter subunit IIA [Lachnospiraceae bacterium]|nr:PTS lactose/cellobiose transporter subunit IIA [Lachnospiraceae bacterium]
MEEIKMDEEKYLPAFQMIMNAGNSRSKSMEALEAARNYDFELARVCLKEAEDELHQAHEAQTEMISAEAGGNAVEVNIILVHSQDHLTMAMMARDFAEEMIHVYEAMKELKGE